MSDKLEAALGPNPEEVREALMLEGEAVYNRKAIEKLPGPVGSRLRWVHNGLVWERVGDNKWVPIKGDVPGMYFNPDDTSPSSHIVRFLWETIE